MTVSIKRFSIMTVLALCLGFTAIGQSVNPSKDLPNLYKINSNLFRGGQPTEQGIKQLKELGVKTIIDLRDDDERARKEKRWVLAAGLRFINIPMANWFGPKDETVEAIIKQIDRAENQPVFVHCKRGSDRTGTVIAIYRITHDGWTTDQAMHEAKQFGIGWWQVWMKDYINHYDHDDKSSH